METEKSQFTTQTKRKKWMQNKLLLAAKKKKIHITKKASNIFAQVSKIRRTLQLCWSFKLCIVGYMGGWMNIYKWVYTSHVSKTNHSKPSDSRTPICIITFINYEAVEMRNWSSIVQPPTRSSTGKVTLTNRNGWYSTYHNMTLHNIH